MKTANSTEKIKPKIKLRYLVLLLFIISGIFYVNLDKMPLEYPGNLKSADSFYHALMVEGILDTGQWNYYDYAISLGHEKALNSQPPLYYINSAILTIFSGVPAWSSFYFLICISQAFFVVIVYLISKELFNSNKISFLAAALSVLPYPPKAWLYTLYIGIWIQVAGYFFLMTYLWLFIRFIKKKEAWALFFMGICIGSISLLHPQDLSILFVPSIYIAYLIIKNNLRNKKNIIMEMLFFGLVPAIILIVLLPRFLFLWGAQGSNQFRIGFFGLRKLWFTRQYSSGYVFPDIFFMPALLLALFAIGFFQIFLNKKKYMPWIMANLYFFFITYLLPIIIEQPYYFARARALTPFILFPSIAYGIYYIAMEKISNLYIYIAAALLIIGLAIPSYIKLASQMQGELIPEQEWQAYKWIQNNTEKDSKILFFGSVFQSEYIYTKRITAAFGIDEMQRLLSIYAKTNKTPVNFKGDWGANTLRTTRRIEKDWWHYKEFDEPSGNLSLFDFDYVFFQNIMPEVAKFNGLFASSYIKNYNFSLAYNKDGYIILKNNNPT